MSNVNPGDGRPPLLPQDVFDAVTARPGTQRSPQELSTQGITPGEDR